MSEDRMDRDLHAWLAGPMERMPEAALQAAFAVTAQTRQRSRLSATLAGTPTMRSATTRLPITRQILVAAALLLALAAALFIVGQIFKDDRLVIAPTPPASALPTGALATGPSATDGPEATPDITTVFQVPGTTALFRTTLSGEWRRARDDAPADGGVRIDARTEIGPGFDPVVTAWVTIRATDQTIEAMEAQLAVEGWTAAPEPLDVAGLSGVIMPTPVGSTLDPTAIVVVDAATYRILGHDNDGPSNSRSLLLTFLGRFLPLGMAPPEEAYVDETWGFSLAYAAAAGQFLPGAEVAVGVTRFADVDCGAGNAATCERYVDVVRLPNASPLHLHLPDGRDVELAINTKSGQYVRLAAEWEAKVGTSRGSSAYYWLGRVIYNVDNVTIHGRFIHRGDQWLVLLSSEDTGADRYRLDDFLNGFTLLAPRASTSPPS